MASSVASALPSTSSNSKKRKRDGSADKSATKVLKPANINQGKTDTLKYESKRAARSPSVLTDKIVTSKKNLSRTAFDVGVPRKTDENLSNARKKKVPTKLDRMMPEPRKDGNDVQKILRNPEPEASLEKQHVSKEASQLESAGPSNTHPDGTSPSMASNKSSIAKTIQSSEELDVRTQKLQKAMTKYLKRADMSVSVLSTSLKLTKFKENPFFIFVRKYFTSNTPEELEKMTQKVLSLTTTHVNTPNRQLPAAESSAGVKRQPSRKPRVDKDLEKAGRNTSTSDMNPPDSVIEGPLTQKEKDIVRAYISDFCELKGLSQHEFCARLHIPNKRDFRREKEEVHASLLRLLPGRKRKSIRDYVRRAYTPYERSKFTPEDDEMVIKLRAEKGADWVAIAECMGRFSYDVRDRYRNHLLIKDARLGAWTAEESKKYLDIVSQYKSRDDISWGTVSELMGTRARAQCRDRYYVLFDEQGELRNRAVVAKNVKKTSPLKAAPQSGAVRAARVKMRLLLGDELHMLKLLKKSKVESLDHAFEKELFAVYEDVFSSEDIAACLEKRLAHGRKTFRKNVKAAISELSSMEQRLLLRTIVSDNDEE